MPSPATTTAAAALDLPSCAGAELLPIDPYRSLRVRFGMLLGEDDFATLSAYHRGKTWLHAAWLHRQGVVWGLGVEPDPGKNEIRVRPGLALDALGRELHLDVPMCVDVGAWLDQRSAEQAASAGQGGGATGATPRELPPWAVRGGDGVVRFPAHVTIRFRSCLDRQVPALSEPCDGGNRTTTYSRVVETVTLRLEPGPAPERADPPQAESPATPPLLPYHRLRVLFGLEAALVDGAGNPLAADREALDARAAIAAAAPGDRTALLLDAFRRLAAFDGIDLGPADDDGVPSLVPGAEPGALVLANLPEVALSGTFETWKLEAPLDAAGVDPTVRFAHVATSTIQELLCAAACCLGEAPAFAPSLPTPRTRAAAHEAAGERGPRLDLGAVAATAKRITLEADAPLAPASVTASAIVVTAFDPEDGWTTLDVKGVALAAGDTRVTVALKDPIRGRLVRLVARGTGARPILGANGLPLGAPAGERHDGRDFNFTIERS